MIAGVAAGVALALLAFAASFLVFKSLVRSLIRQSFSGEKAPLMAWRIFSPRQLEMLLREASPNLQFLLSRRETTKLSEHIRSRHRTRIRNFEAMQQVEEVASFLDESAISLASGVGEGTAQRMAAVGVEHMILRADKPAQYYPFGPPQGPIRLPAEYEAIQSVLLAWPTQYTERWANHARLAALITQRACAHIVVPNAAWAAAVALFLESAGANRERVRFICAPNDDVWIRDFGPTLVQTATGPAFIANPYVPNGLGFHKRDHELPAEIARVYGLPVHRLPLVIEGGNILSDGAGRLFLTDSVFEHNTDINRRELGDVMARWFGAAELTVLPAMPGELTGHIDIALKLSNAGGAWVTEASPGHPWRAALDEIAAVMARTKTPKGDYYRVVRMPMAPVRSGISELCYCNALTLNGAILFPSYASESDLVAKKAFHELEPDTALSGISYSEFRVGALHCQTKEVAAL